MLWINCIGCLCLLGHHFSVSIPTLYYSGVEGCFIANALIFPHSGQSVSPIWADKIMNQTMAPALSLILKQDREPQRRTLNNTEGVISGEHV